jgi:hypothetical protein
MKWKAGDGREEDVRFRGRPRPLRGLERRTLNDQRPILKAPLRVRQPLGNWALDVGRWMLKPAAPLPGPIAFH